MLTYVRKKLICFIFLSLLVFLCHDSCPVPVVLSGLAVQIHGIDQLIILRHIFFQVLVVSPVGRVDLRGRVVGGGGDGGGGWGGSQVVHHHHRRQRVDHCVQVWNTKKCSVHLIECKVLLYHRLVFFYNHICLKILLFYHEIIIKAIIQLLLMHKKGRYLVI